MRSSWCIVLVALASCSNPGSSADRASAAVPQAPEACAPGTRPVLGEASCVPVGPHVIPQGFQARADGWGFAAVLPSSPCQGATRAVLGETSCVPIDDCDAPFPPPEASIVVSTSATYSGRTVSSSIEDALARASEGATIALDRGTYPAFSVGRSVRIVGRCASETRIFGSDARGVYITRGDVTLEHVSVDGFQGGIVAAAAEPGDTNVTLKNVRVHNASIGLIAGWDAVVRIDHSVLEGREGSLNSVHGGNVVGEELDVRASMLVADEPSKLSLARSVVQANPSKNAKAVIMAFSGGDLRLEECHLRARSGELISTGRLAPSKAGRGGTVTLERSELVQSSNGPQGASSAIRCDAESRCRMHDSALLYGSMFGISAGNDSSVELERSSLMSDGSEAPEHMAVYGTMGARLLLHDSAVVRSRGNGLTVGGARTSAEVRGCRIDATEAGPGQENVEAGAVGIGVGGEATLLIDDSAITRTAGIGVGASTGTMLSMSHSLVEDTRATPSTNPSMKGVGIDIDGALSVEIRDSLVRKSASAAVSFVDSALLATSTFLTDSEVGLRLRSGASFQDYGTSTGEPPQPARGRVHFYRSGFVRNQRTIEQVDR